MCLEKKQKTDIILYMANKNLFTVSFRHVHVDRLGWLGAAKILRAIVKNVVQNNAASAAGRNFFVCTPTCNIFGMH